MFIVRAQEPKSHLVGAFPNPPLDENEKKKRTGRIPVQRKMCKFQKIINLYIFVIFCFLIK